MKLKATEVKEIRDIVHRAVCYPTVTIDSEIVPVYARHKKCENAAAVVRTKQFESAVKTYGVHSPNCVRAIRIGTDAVIKTMFDGTEVRGSFGYDGSRKIAEAAYLIADKQADSISGLLECLLRNKMSNLEELYISKELLMVAGININNLNGLNLEDLAKATIGDEFGYRLFNGKSITREFKRIAVVGLGDRVTTAQQFRGNWEIFRDTESGKNILVNRCWVVQEKIYEKDEELYTYVSDYMRKLQ